MRALLLALLLFTTPALACDPAFDATCNADHQQRQDDANHEHWHEWPCRGDWQSRQWYRENDPQWYAERCQ